MKRCRMAKMKLLVPILLVILIVSLAFNVLQYTGSLSTKPESSKEEMALLIIHDAADINSELLKLDALISAACQELSTTGLTGSAADKVLSDLYSQNSNIVVNAATADKNDVLLAVQPSNYNGIIGEDIASQEQNIEMHRTMRPALSNLIGLVEGFPGIVMVAPVFNQGGQFIGSLSIVFQPYQLIQPVVAESMQGVYTIYALQNNGTLIYDAGPEQGKNIFTDQEYQGYTELQTFIHQVVGTQSGYGTYSYYDDLQASRPLVSKEAYWTTIGIYNTDWRLVIARTL